MVIDTKVPLFKDHVWHFQIKIKFQRKKMRQGSVHLPDTDFFWIIPCSREYSVILKKQSFAMLKVTQNQKYWIFISSQYVLILVVTQLF